MIFPQYHQYTPNIIFMGDNLLPHSARIVILQLVLRKSGFLIWRGQVPQAKHMLNPMKLVWNQLKLSFDARAPTPHDIAELRVTLKWRSGTLSHRTSLAYLGIENISIN
jgi:hypothetical protein